MWIELLKNRKLVSLFTYWSVDDERDANWLARVNDMNSKIMLPQFSYCRGSVWGGYWMTFEGGLNVRQFVKILRFFSGAFAAGVLKNEEEGAKTPKPDLAVVKPSV